MDEWLILFSASEREAFRTYSDLSPSSKKQVLDLIENLKRKDLTCKYLSWEMEGSICEIHCGTKWGRCSCTEDTTKCPYAKV